MATNFNELAEFSKEFHRLAKKYRSLPDDLEEFKRVLLVKPQGTGKHFNIITRQEGVCVVVKARLFCRYLKGSSLRIIYAYHETTTTIEFIEIYFKGEKENEYRERIKEYLKIHNPPTTKFEASPPEKSAGGFPAFAVRLRTGRQQEAGEKERAMPPLPPPCDQGRR